MTYSSSMAMNRQRLQARDNLARPQRSSRGFGSMWGKNQNTTSFENKKGGIGPISNSITLIILACILGLLYLTQVTKTNAHGYRINELEHERTQLKEEHDELEVASARLQALSRVKDSEVAKSLVTVAPAATIQN